jgi:hypothetical protein
MILKKPPFTRLLMKKVQFQGEIEFSGEEDKFPGSFSALYSKLRVADPEIP